MRCDAMEPTVPCVASCSRSKISPAAESNQWSSPSPRSGKEASQAKKLGQATTAHHTAHPTKKRKSQAERYGGRDDVDVQSSPCHRHGCKESSPCSCGPRLRRIMHGGGFRSRCPRLPAGRWVSELELRKRAGREGDRKGWDRAAESGASYVHRCAPFVFLSPEPDTRTSPSMAAHKSRRIGIIYYIHVVQYLLFFWHMVHGRLVVVAHVRGPGPVSISHKANLMKCCHGPGAGIVGLPMASSNLRHRSLLGATPKLREGNTPSPHRIY